MKRRYHEHSQVLLLVGVAISRACCDAASLVHVVVGGSWDPPKYPGQVATFGNQAARNLFVPNLNLILPPSNESQLCRYPERAVEWDTDTAPLQLQHDNSPYQDDEQQNNSSYMIIEEDDSHLVARENMSVALFVSYGECLPARKAKVALDLRRNFTRYGTVTHLVIYNNDYSNMDELHTLTSYLHDEDEFKDITIIFISTRSGHDIMQSIKAEEQRQRIASPIFFAEGNEFWYMPVSFLEPPPWELNYGFNTNDPHGDYFGDPSHHYPPQRTDSGIPESDDFYWFRLIVFSLLVVSPCFRAAYLWYAGGARIRFRYNENGRIVGLQYIPPMPYWFAPRPDENESHPASRMTREQVMALPEIVYSGSPDASSECFLTDNSNSNNNSNNTESKPEVASPKEESNETADNDESPSITASGTDSSFTTPLASSSEGEDHASSNAINTDEEQPSPSGMHSTCSICIDDFEQGERLRMLPRCRHIFHTDCILPWLTERQGCCPLCKTEVIEPEHEEDGSERSHHDHHTRTILAQSSADSADVFTNEGQPQNPLETSVESADVFCNEDHPQQQQQQQFNNLLPNAGADVFAGNVFQNENDQPQQAHNVEDQNQNNRTQTLAQGDTTDNNDPEIALLPEVVESNDEDDDDDDEPPCFHNEYDELEEGRQKRMPPPG